MAKEKEMLRASEVAQRFGVQAQKVFEMARLGDFPHFDGQTETGAHLWSDGTVNAWLSQHPEWTTPVSAGVMSAPQVCIELKISMTALYRWIDAGKLPQPTLVRRVDHGGNFYGGLMKVWSRQDVMKIKDAANAK